MTFCLKFFTQLQEEIEKIPINDFGIDADQMQSRKQKIDQLIEDQTRSLKTEEKKRIKDEIYNFGPLNSLFEDEEITEILVNGRTSIWFERHGKLFKHDDIFFTHLSFRNIIDRICQLSQTHLTVEYPYADGHFNNFRLTLIGAPLTGNEVNLSFRRHPKNPWNLDKLVETNWCDHRQKSHLIELIKSKQNILIIGPTSSGKTSVLNSFLNCIDSNERALIIEDSPELSLPNGASARLLTRHDPHGILSSIDQGQLVKNSLRLRPDRLIMGEMRGAEAKDFLMALATGHLGSLGTLHASDARQALIRLEMLIQMGAPQWNLQAIRRLIFLSLRYIVVTARILGERKLQGVFKITSLEETGFLIEPDLSYSSQG